MRIHTHTLNCLYMYTQSIQESTYTDKYPVFFKSCWDRHDAWCFTSTTKKSEGAYTYISAKMTQSFWRRTRWWYMYTGFYSTPGDKQRYNETNQSNSYSEFQAANKCQTIQTRHWSISHVFPKHNIRENTHTKHGADTRPHVQVLGHRAFHRYYRQSLRPLQELNREGTRKVVALLMDTYNQRGVMTRYMGSSYSAKVPARTVLPVSEKHMCLLFHCVLKVSWSSLLMFWQTCTCTCPALLSCFDKSVNFSGDVLRDMHVHMCCLVVMLQTSWYHCLW